MINKNDYKEELKNFLERMKEFFKREDFKIVCTRQVKYLKERFEDLETFEINNKKINDKKCDDKSMSIYKKINKGEDVKCIVVALKTANISNDDLKKFKDKENKFDFVALCNGWYYNLIADEESNDNLYELLEKI